MVEVTSIPPHCKQYECCSVSWGPEHFSGIQLVSTKGLSPCPHLSPPMFLLRSYQPLPASYRPSICCRTPLPSDGLLCLWHLPVRISVPNTTSTGGRKGLDACSYCWRDSMQQGPFVLYIPHHQNTIKALLETGRVPKSTIPRRPSVLVQLYSFLPTLQQMVISWQFFSLPEYPELLVLDQMISALDILMFKHIIKVHAHQHLFTSNFKTFNFSAQFRLLVCWESQWMLGMWRSEEQSSSECVESRSV